MKRNKLYLEWILKAQDDWRSAEILLKEDGSPNTICFLCQQTAEKYLKGYLVFEGKEFPKIHDLESLLKLCLKIDPKFKTIKNETKFLSNFYITTRYPGDYPELSPKDAEEAFQKAIKIKDFVMERIK